MFGEAGLDAVVLKNSHCVSRVPQVSMAVRSRGGWCLQGCDKGILGLGGWCSGVGVSSGFPQEGHSTFNLRLGVSSHGSALCGLLRSPSPWFALGS